MSSHSPDMEREPWCKYFLSLKVILQPQIQSDSKIMSRSHQFPFPLEIIHSTRLSTALPDHLTEKPQVTGTFLLITYVTYFTILNSYSLKAPYPKSLGLDCFRFWTICIYTKFVFLKGMKPKSSTRFTDT